MGSNSRQLKLTDPYAKNHKFFQKMIDIHIIEM